MKSLLSIVLLALLLSSCSLFGKKDNSNNSNNSNSTPATAKNKFIGTWELAPESVDFGGGPITIKEDGTYEAKKTNKPASSTFTGGYTIKDDKLFFDGQLKGFSAEGFSLEGDNRLKLPREGKTIYFVRK